MLDELGGAELEAFGDIGSIMPPRRRRSSSADAPQSPLDQAFGWRVQDSAKGAKVHTITGMEGDAALVSMSGSARAGLTASAIGTFRTLASPPPLSVDTTSPVRGNTTLDEQTNRSDKNRFSLF